MTTMAAPLFDAVLRPHRSLTPLGLRLLVGAFGVACAALGVGFWLIGAWPVAGFFGLDVALLYGALKLSMLSARRTERLRLTEHELVVRRVDPWGRVDDVRIAPPHWLRVEIDDPVRHDSQLRLVSHGRGVTVGGFLMSSERGDLARTLRAALRRLVQSPSTSFMA
ncbi:MAG: DUF2244 domain-containing protein [Alphaproteobacteria bacterium]|nr:DUF2244 domain-containing protein [Alphaproteobacteria bacterium]